MGPTGDVSADDHERAGDAPSGGVRLLVVAAIVAAQAVGLFAFAVYLIVNLVAGTHETTATRNTVIETVAFIVVAGLLGLVARGCLRAQRWTRAPVLVVELIALLGVGRPMLQGDLWYRFVLGIPITVGAIVAIVLMLTPTVTATMYGNPEEP